MTSITRLQLTERIIGGALAVWLIMLLGSFMVGGGLMMYGWFFVIGICLLMVFGIVGARRYGRERE